MSPAFDSPAWRELRNQKLRAWLLDNDQALEVVLALSHVSETWDDLIDQDRKPTPQDIHQTFLNLLVHLPANTFWQQYQGAILPIVTCAINGWLDANDLQDANSKRLRELGFYLRNLTWEVATICVYIVGGWRHLRDVSMAMREFFVHEDFDQWEVDHVVRQHARSA